MLLLAKMRYLVEQLFAILTSENHRFENEIGEEPSPTRVKPAQ